MKELRTCVVCGVQYDFCPKCNKDEPIWKFTFCSEKCKNTYHVLSAYENGMISADDTNNALKKLDMTDFQSVGKSYSDTLKKLKEELQETKQASSNNDEQVETDVIKSASEKVKIRYYKKSEKEDKDVE